MSQQQGGPDGADLRADGATRQAVAQLLWEGKAELESPVIEYLSEVIWKEAVYPADGRSDASLVSAIRLFAPSLQMDNLEERVEGLLNQAREAARRASKLQSHLDSSPPALQEELLKKSPPENRWSPPLPSESPIIPGSPVVGARSPPAAAFLASSTSAQDFLKPRSSSSIDPPGLYHANASSDASQLGRPLVGLSPHDSYDSSNFSLLGSSMDSYSAGGGGDGGGGGGGCVSGSSTDAQASLQHSDAGSHVTVLSGNGGGASASLGRHSPSLRASSSGGAEPEHKGNGLQVGSVTMEGGAGVGAEGSITSPLLGGLGSGDGSGRSGTSVDVSRGPSPSMEATQGGTQGGSSGSSSSLGLDGWTQEDRLSRSGSSRPLLSAMSEEDRRDKEVAGPHSERGSRSGDSGQEEDRQSTLMSQLSFGRISLNPNAAEFVPTFGSADDDAAEEGSIRSAGSGGGSLPQAKGKVSQHQDGETEATELLGPPFDFSRQPFLDRNDSTNSNASDDEYRRYWREQLPDELLSFDSPRDIASHPPLLQLGDDGRASMEQFTFLDQPPRRAGPSPSAGLMAPPLPPPMGQGGPPPNMALGLGPPQLPMGLPGMPRAGSPRPGPVYGAPPSPGPRMGPPMGRQGSPLQSPAGGGGWAPAGGSGGMPPLSISLGPSSALSSPHMGGGGGGAGGGGGEFGYTSPVHRSLRSPHPSPHSGVGPFSPPGQRFLDHGNRGAMTPPARAAGGGFNRTFLSPELARGGGPPVDLRHGHPPPFELPPGMREGQLDRLSWEASGGRFDMEPDPAAADAVGMLAAEFPGFAADSLADIYYANGRDFHLTLEMLTQLELQEEAGQGPPHHYGHPPSLSPPLTPMDFPALPEIGKGGVYSAHHHVGGGLEPLSPMPPRRSLDEMGMRSPPPDFASALRKSFERNGERGRGHPMGPPLGPGGFPGEREREREHFNAREMPRGLQQPWLETGDAVGNLYAEMREEARDHARVRNTYFEQATQAYLAGNKGLAKMLSAKGQWHNEQMKAAHAKASDVTFRERNPGYIPGLGGGIQGAGPGRGHARILDLHGLHVNEAIPLLKREIAALRAAARSTRQRQQIFVCVGTGHHTKGRAPPRLPMAVERYLAEDEHIEFVETKPGMLRVTV
eukprot:SM000039S14465  [mRNA]  locus=s39:341731:347674:+ [translate_table: standard]